MPRGGCGGDARGPAFFETAVEVEAPGGRARAPVRAARPVGQDQSPFLVVAQAAARLGVQMHGRAPAAGNGHQVAGDALALVSGPAFGPAEQDAAHPAAAENPLDGLARAAGQVAHIAAGPGVGHGGDADAGAPQQPRHPVDAVIVAGDDGLPPGQHAIGMGIAAGRGCRHDARPVVPVEEQRAFMRAGGDHDLARPHEPEPHCRRTGRALLLSGPLGDRQQVVVVISGDGGAVEQADMAHRLQFGGRGVDPGERVALVDLARRAQQVAAEAGILVGEHYPRPGARRRQRRRHARRPAARHQHIGVDAPLGVEGVVRCARRRPEARHAPDQRLVE